TRRLGGQLRVARDHRLDDLPVLVQRQPESIGTAPQRVQGEVRAAGNRFEGRGQVRVTRQVAQRAVKSLVQLDVRRDAPGVLVVPAVHCLVLGQNRAQVR